MSATVAPLPKPKPAAADQKVDPYGGGLMLDLFHLLGPLQHLTAGPSCSTAAQLWLLVCL